MQFLSDGDQTVVKVQLIAEFHNGKSRKTLSLAYYDPAEKARSVATRLSIYG